MHKQQKIQLLNIINAAQKLHEKLPKIINESDRIAVLTECQQAAISVGETLENIGGDDNGVIHLLEEYCEMIFELSQLEAIGQNSICDVQKQLNNVSIELEKIPTKYRVVFLPYKADMWDSLESIWRECVADPRCECDVVPIPYFELNRKEKKWEPHYDGARFPKEVRIVHYDYYKMDEMQPDIAYIHNPYDDCNNVTTVHPYYYSKELKKYVNKLVYVPYYANTGFIASVQLQMPVLRNMDYMVVQSENAKETCKDAHFYNRVLPLGSPKFDKVINKSNNVLPVDIPQEWRAIIKDKKVLMLNTTINDLLEYNEVLLNKLKYFFELIKKNDEVALIWRPHPLLEATIKSLRPHMLPQYIELIDYFEVNKIGILDFTSDVSNTVAIADGYVGSSYSSVINLFGVCGKPIYLFDNLFYEDVNEGKKDILFKDIVAINNNLYAVAEQWGNTLLQLNGQSLAVIGNIERECKWFEAYWSMATCKGKLYLSPFRASHTLEYDVANSNYVKMLDVGRELGVHFLRSIVAKNKVYFLPFNDFLMMEYDTDTCKWSYHTNCMADLWGEDEMSSGMWRTCGGAACGDCIWITTGHTNSVLQFNINDSTYKVHRIGETTHGYSELVADEFGLWLTDSKTGDIVRWQYGANKIKEFHMPDGFECWKNLYGIMKTHAGLLDMGRYLITVPGHANYMVKFDKETGESHLLVPEFWEHASETVNGFAAKYVTTGGASVKLDDTHILVQRKCDCAMAKVDVVNNTYEQFMPTLSDEDFDKLMTGEDGFEKAGKMEYFCRRESKNFTISGFIDDLVEGRLEGVRERQLEALSTLAANLDGTCGQKVHEYMMNVLENKN